MGKKSTVIKSSVVVTPRAEGMGLRSFQVNDIMREARETMRTARAEAEAILHKAKEHAAVIEHQAREQGYKDGFARGGAEGREAGQAEAFASASRTFAQQQESLIQACQQMLAGLEADRLAWNATARQDLVDLAIAIARRVVGHVSQQHREAIVKNLEEAARLVGARSDVTIAVHPDEAEAARLFAKSLVELQEQCQHVRVVPDPQVSGGGCRICWRTGVVDATVETQLERIAAELRHDSDPAGSSPQVREDG